MDFSTKGKSLPERGTKKLRKDENDSDTERINATLDHYKSLFNAECQKSTRSVAIWDSKNNKVVLTKRIGKMFEFFGKQTKTEFTLEPDETLYLIEMNYLELRWNNLPLSLQQAYAILLRGFDKYTVFENYKVYTDLLRKGYKVLHHGRKKRSLKEVEAERESSTSVSSVTKAVVQEPLKEDNTSIETKHISSFKPLLKSNYENLSDMISDLQIIKQGNFTEISDNEKIDILYDVYTSSTVFSKIFDASPNFSVCVTRSDDRLPTPDEMYSLRKSTEVPVIHAIASQKGVSYYQIENVCLPQLVTTDPFSL